MNKAVILTLASATALSVTACSMGGHQGDDAMAAPAQPPFGGEQDVAYAEALWQAMADEDLVGDTHIMSTPYTGQHPHGAILDTIDRRLTFRGHTGQVIVKRNYGGEGVSKQAVADAPARWLQSITVMYRREAGYDSDNMNWFWAKYAPDGGVLTNPKDMQLAGRVAKGANQGCIACHQAAPGGDYVFNHDRVQ